jgi:hypothetical protein
MPAAVAEPDADDAGRGGEARRAVQRLHAARSALIRRERDTVSLTLMSTVWWACAVVGVTSIEITFKTGATRPDGSRRAESFATARSGRWPATAQGIALWTADLVNADRGQFVCTRRPKS